jgi:ribosomal-protein-alanine acetyltransferase
MSSLAEVLVRPMSAADVERVLKIAESLREAPQWAASAYLAAINPDHSPRRIALVAADVESGAPIGFLVASLMAPEAELETIAVAAEGQRRGVGARLLGTLQEELKMERVTELLLEVRASNHGALGFYAALGFRETGRRPRYYADPEEDAVLMGLRFG